MQMDEQVEHNTGETFSLTPRPVAVMSHSLEPVTVSTVFLPTHISISMTPARLTISQRIKERLKETVKTVPSCRQRDLVM
jgi:hypothetical protein